MRIFFPFNIDIPFTVLIYSLNLLPAVRTQQPLMFNRTPTVWTKFLIFWLLGSGLTRLHVGPLHTAGVSGFIVMLFALGYGLSGCLQYSVQNPCLYQQIKDSIYFSFVTFTTLGLGDISPLNDLGKVLICCEAVIGAFLIALFVVVFARKMIR